MSLFVIVEEPLTFLEEEIHSKLHEYCVIRSCLRVDRLKYQKSEVGNVF